MNQSAQAGVTPLEPPPTARLLDLIDQIESVLTGKREQIVMALACFLGRGHLLIEDVPGVGKTTLAHALSRTLGLEWNRIQFTSDLLPADVVGVSIFNTQANSFKFQQGPIFTPILLADEINRAPPRAQSALLEAMEERQVTVDGHTYPLSYDFFVIATQNPNDQLGAFPLPESQLDRFLVGLEIGYPDASTERALLEHGDTRNHVKAIESVLDQRDLRYWRDNCDSIYISGPVLDYIQALLNATRSTNRGLSPRAGLSLVRLCRAFAVINQRDHVLPEDVRGVFPAVAGHRLTGQVRSGYKLARQILDEVAMP